MAIIEEALSKAFDVKGAIEANCYELETQLGESMVKLVAAK